MMLDNPKEKVIFDKISDKKLQVDLALFSLALKNLIGNGIQYSSDGVVHVKVEDKKLSICSKDKKFSLPLEEYFKPFTNLS